MLLRPKLFLTSALISAAPLLLISVIAFLYALSGARALTRAELQRELVASESAIDSTIQRRQQQLITLAKSRAFSGYLRMRGTLGPSVETEAEYQGPRDASEAEQLETFLSDLIAPLLTDKGFASIALFSPDRQLLFRLEQNFADPKAPVAFRTQGLFDRNRDLDQRVWSMKHDEVICWHMRPAELGPTLRCTTPLFVAESQQGAVVGDIRLDAVVTQVARRYESKDLATISLVALDGSGHIVYHRNDALKHQNVSVSLPELAEVAPVMVGGQSGEQFYFSADGSEYLATYAPAESAGLSLAVLADYSAATAGVRRWGWFTLAVAAAIGFGLATLLTVIFQRKEQSLERLTEGVTAIAKGELNLNIDARSREDIRELAEGVNLVKERLREQLAQEAEVRQIESFVRFSAMLTHDLKNAIGGLSLLVQNMEQHFDNEDFRTEALTTLRQEAEKLKTLVEKISNPITTLSGEYKRPEPVDLVQMIRGVLARQNLGRHQVHLNLPTVVIAVVDAERIEKVLENLVLNALEAMHKEEGILTVAAGEHDVDRVFFSVSDTGIGMTKPFIEQKLFRAFSTTKQKGMGLGLYTCREVVSANGGTIHVTSKTGAGTTFRVVLPSRAPDELIAQ